MGQYWRHLCRETRECISAHSFGYGLKYIEQLGSPTLCNALMLLKTDMSSLGHGGGDLRLDEDVFPAMKPFVVAVIGRWFGKTADFVGDYTENKELELQNEDGSDKYKDISEEVAAAVWALEFSDWLFKHGKDAKAKFLEKNRERIYMFGEKEALQSVFAAADNFEWSGEDEDEDDDNEDKAKKQCIEDDEAKKQCALSDKPRRRRARPPKTSTSGALLA